MAQRLRWGGQDWGSSQLQQSWMSLLFLDPAIKIRVPKDEALPFSGIRKWEKNKGRQRTERNTDREGLTQPLKQVFKTRDPEIWCLCLLNLTCSQGWHYLSWATMTVNLQRHLYWTSYRHRNTLLLGRLPLEKRPMMNVVVPSHGWRSWTDKEWAEQAGSALEAEVGRSLRVQSQPGL